MSHFLWKTPQESLDQIEKKRSDIEDEIADIAIYLFELADNLDIDLISAMDRKIQKNDEKYPVEKARGSNAKYTEL